MILRARPQCARPGVNCFSVPLLPSVESSRRNLSAKLFPVKIGWQELRASDLQARARSVDSLVKAGVDSARAMEIAGLST